MILRVDYFLGREGRCVLRSHEGSNMFKLEGIHWQTWENHEQLLFFVRRWSIFCGLQFVVCSKKILPKVSNGINYIKPSLPCQPINAT